MTGHARRLLIFIGLTGVAVVLTGPLVGSLSALAGGKAGVAPWLFALCMSVLVLVVTWLMLRSDGASLADLGLSLKPQRRREFLLGLSVGIVLFALVALIRAAAVGAPWHMTGVEGIRAALIGLPVALLLLLPEELIFRGYGFRQLQTLTGSRAAVILSAIAFGAYHLIGSGDYAMGAVWRFAMPMLGGLVFGIAAVRTRGLALPIGLHLGGNWVQQSVLGLGHAPPVPGASTGALLVAPLGAAQAQALAAPDVFPHLPYLVALSLAAVVVLRHQRAYRTGNA